MKPAPVVPFPQVRRRRFITKTAERLASVAPKTAEKLLATTLKQQAASMSRRGVPADLVERECRALQSAIRAELWRTVLVPDGRA